MEEQNMGKLEGKIGLVTGGTSGIGLAAAKRFVDEGAYVFITGRREPELATAVKEIGRSLTGVQSDVSKLDDLDRLFALCIYAPCVWVGYLFGTAYAEQNRQ